MKKENIDQAFLKALAPMIKPRVAESSTGGIKERLKANDQTSDPQAYGLTY